MDLFVLFDFCSFGLWFVFWVLISLCVPRFDFSWVWVGFDFSVCSLGWFLMGMGWIWFLFFGLISHGYGLFWFLCSVVDSHRSGLVLISLFLGWFLMDLGFDFSVIWVWVLNFSVLYVGHLSAIILHDQSRFNVSYFSSFKDIFCQWDPKYYVYLLMPNKVSVAAMPVNWLKIFEGQLCQYHLFFFLFFFFQVFTPTKGGAVFYFALYL